MMIVSRSLIRRSRVGIASCFRRFSRLLLGLRSLSRRRLRRLGSLSRRLGLLRLTLRRLSFLRLLYWRRLLLLRRLRPGLWRLGLGRCLLRLAGRCRLLCLRLLLLLRWLRRRLLRLVLLRRFLRLDLPLRLGRLRLLPWRPWLRLYLQWVGNRSRWPADGAAAAAAEAGRCRDFGARLIGGPIAQTIERRLVDRFLGLPLVDALLVVERPVAAVACTQQDAS